MIFKYTHSVYSCYRAVLCSITSTHVFKCTVFNHVSTTSLPTLILHSYAGHEDKHKQHI